MDRRDHVMKSRVVLVGAGGVAKHYANLFAKEANFEVVAVVDVDLSRAELQSKDWGAKFFVSLTDALDHCPAEVAIITTPSGFHYQNVKQALGLGLHVIVEKPISLRLTETEELIQLAREKELHLLPVYQNRSNSAVIWTLDNIGEIGKLSSCSVRLRWSRNQDYYLDSWHGTWLLDGGVSSQQGIHHLDLFLEIGGPVNKVCALESNQSNDLEAEDTMIAIVEFCSGSVGTVELTTSLRPRDAEAVVSFSGDKGFGEVGGTALNEITNWVLTDDDKRDSNFHAQFSQDVPNGMGFGHLNYITQCFDFIQGLTSTPPLTAERGLLTERFVHSLYVSNERGGWVTLNEIGESNRLGRS